MHWTVWCLRVRWGLLIWKKLCKFISLLTYNKKTSFSSPSLLPCLQQRSVWSFCTNEELLRLGLARTAPIVGVPPDSRLYWRLHRRLHRAEVKAEKKGRGLWKTESLWERTSKALRDNPLIRLMRRIFRKTEWLINPSQAVYYWELWKSSFKNTNSIYFFFSMINRTKVSVEILMKYKNVKNKYYCVL